MARREEGAVAATTTILLTALILMAAVVVDLGMLRVDHRDSQTVSDLAAAAAGLELGSDLDRVAACEAAWDFVVNNLSEIPDSEDPPAGNTCSTNFSGACDPAVEDEMEVPLAGGITLVITMPVQDGNPLMQPARQGIVDRDGEPCERVAVNVIRQSEHLLAAVAGFDNGSSFAGAVARRTEVGTETEYSTLIILRAQDCESQDTSGGTGIIVFNHVDGSVVTPGVVTADTVSAGGCASNKTVYRAAGGGYLCAGLNVDSGTEDAAALDIDDDGKCVQTGTGPNGTVTSVLDETLRTFATDSTHWLTEGSPGSVEPDVIEGNRITRSLADHAYNCDVHNYDGRGIYPSFASATPQYPVVGANEPEIDDCVQRNVAGIDLLVGAFIDGNAHSGFTTIGCAPDPDDLLETHLVVDCPSAMGALALPNAEIVVMNRLGGPQDGVNLSGGANSLTIGSPGGQDAMMIVPAGGIAMSGGSLFLHNTMTYLHDDSASFSVTSDAPQIFTAPQEVGWDEDTSPHTAVNCVTTTIGGHVVPDQSCFQNLTFWGNGNGSHKLTGGALIEARGVFFFPRAGRHNGRGFEMGGNASAGPGLDLTNAQFFTWRIDISGQKPVLMRPNPDVFLENPAYGTGLIR